MQKSENCFNLLLSRTPNGTQTLSKMPCRFIEGIYPKVLSNGKNGWIVDVDGNQFIDLISGLGAVSAGYSHTDINRAVMDQIYKGTSFSLPTMLEYEVAERLCQLIPSTEMWKFGKNGTDGTVTAVRAARAFTGREKIMTVGYNGCSDVFECKGTRSAGIPSRLQELNTKAAYNNLNSFQDLNSKQYAAVILEPMVFEYPLVEFLHELRKLCSETGTVLIFDEVVSGGRFTEFAAQNYFKVLPDLTVLSKGIANGFPLCAVGGKRFIMETFERNDFFASGTFGGEAVSLAACLATLDVLCSGIANMVARGSQIQNTFNSLFEGLALCKGYPTRLMFEFPTDVHKAVFMQEMCLNGVLLGQSNFVMATHTDLDVSDICKAIEQVYLTMQEHWKEISILLKGKMPEATFKVR